MLAPDASLALRVAVKHVRNMTRGCGFDQASRRGQGSNVYYLCMAPLRFSLKWLLAFVAMVAVSVAALVNASGVWAIGVVTLVSATTLAALLSSVFGAARLQPFAGGYVIGFAFYFLLWTAADNNWLGLNESYLLSCRIVDRVHGVIATENPPPPRPPGGTGLYFGPAVPTFTPDLYSFRAVAHWVIAWYIGLASGLFARWLRSGPSTR